MGAGTAVGRFPPFLCVKCSWFVSSHDGSQQLWHALKPPDLRQSPTSRTPGRRELNVQCATGWMGCRKSQCGGKRHGVDVHRDIQGPFHEQGWSPVTVTLSQVCLTAAFLLRETFQTELERCVIFLQPGQAALGTWCLQSPLRVTCGSWRTGSDHTQDFSLGHLGSGSRSTGGVLEAGCRNTSTHVVLKTESVSGAMV